MWKRIAQIPPVEMLEMLAPRISHCQQMENKTQHM